MSRFVFISVCGGLDSPAAGSGCDRYQCKLDTMDSYIDKWSRQINYYQSMYWNPLELTCN